MTDIPALIVNLGILVVSGVAALVAVVQARAALRDAGRAQKARDEAVEAQKASAAALQDANRIAAAAQDILELQDERSRERHHVEWKPGWDAKTGKWFLSNNGPDEALDVRFTATSPTIDPATDSAPRWGPQRAFTVEFPAYKMAGGVPQVRWRVEWRTPLGAHREADGVWPQY